MIQARELNIGVGPVTVTDLFKLIDMPYKVTSKARVILPQSRSSFHPDNLASDVKLRVEWTVESDDPSV